MSATLRTIVALAGPAGAGKDTAAGHFSAATGGLPWEQLAFASPIRAMLAPLITMATGSSTAAQHWMHDRAAKELPIPCLGQSYRHLAQTLGTEWGRQQLGPTFWVDLLAARVRASGAKRIVITDLRYPEEAAYIDSLGGHLVWVDRATTPVRPHASERGISRDDCHAALDNTGPASALPAQVAKLLRHLRITEPDPAAPPNSKGDGYRVLREGILAWLLDNNDETLTAEDAAVKFGAEPHQCRAVLQYGVQQGVLRVAHVAHGEGLPQYSYRNGGTRP